MRQIGKKATWDWVPAWPWLCPRCGEVTVTRISGMVEGLRRNPCSDTSSLERRWSKKEGGPSQSLPT